MHLRDVFKNKGLFALSSVVFGAALFNAVSATDVASQAFPDNPSTRTINTNSPKFLQFVDGKDARPPFGHVEYCRKNPKRCEPIANPIPFRMTSDLLLNLNEINRKINKTYPYIPDSTFGKIDDWGDLLQNNGGDCEEYVERKWQEFHAAGVPEDKMTKIWVITEDGIHHLEIGVNSQLGDLMASNRNDELRFPSQTNYIFVQATVFGDPGRWKYLEDVVYTPWEPLALSPLQWKKEFMAENNKTVPFPARKPKELGNSGAVIASGRTEQPKSGWTPRLESAGYSWDATFVPNR
jgi:predicted transglutaminase-like cysteine proteinase